MKDTSMHSDAGVFVSILIALKTFFSNVKNRHSDSSFTHITSLCSKIIKKGDKYYLAFGRRFNI